MTTQPTPEQVSRQYLDVPAFVREMLPLRKGQRHRRVDFRSVFIRSYGERRELLDQSACDPTLSPMAHKVLTHLEHFANKDSICIFPNQSTVAVEMGISRETVTRCVDELVKDGYLSVRTKNCPCGQQRGRGNHYRLGRLGYDDERYYDEVAPIEVPSNVINESHYSPSNVTSPSPSNVTSPSPSNVTDPSPVTSTPVTSTPEPVSPTVATLPPESPRATVATLPTPGAPVVLDPGAQKQAAKADKEARRTRLKEDFVPSAEDLAWAAGLGLSEIQIEHHTAEFNSYWRGDGRPKLDWRQTWMNRIRSISGKYLAKSQAQKTVYEREAEHKEFLRESQLHPNLGLRPGETFESQYGKKRGW